MLEQRITISLSSLLFILATVLGLVLLWQLRGLLIILMVAVVLAASISPIVAWAERWHIPRWASVLLVYFTGISVLTGVGLLIGPTVFEQIERIIRQIPTYAETLKAFIEDTVSRLSDTRLELLGQFLDTRSLPGWIIRSSQQLLLRSYGLTRVILGGLVSLILALLISGYMVADSKTLISSLVRLLPQPWEDRVASQIGPISRRMGGYIRGRILVSAILGIVTTISLSYLGLREYSLGLGAIAAVTNLIPFLGPILGAIPALFVAASKGGLLVVWVLILFVIIQNIETYVLDPLLVGSSVGIHPLYQLLAVLGGVQVLGIAGALIVPPWFAGISVLIENLYLRPKLIAERRAAIAQSKSTVILPTQL
jgi:predicted PurR-regulated permease PerM